MYALVSITAGRELAQLALSVATVNVAAVSCVELLDTSISQLCGLCICKV